MRAEGFSCSSKKYIYKNFCCNFFSTLVIKTLDPDSLALVLKMLNGDCYLKETVAVPSAVASVVQFQQRVGNTIKNGGGGSNWAVQIVPLYISDRFE